MGKQLTAIDRNDYEALRAQFDALDADAEKYFHAKKKAAGARLRKGLLTVTRDAHTLRQSLSGINIDKYCAKKEPDNFL